MCRTPTGWAAEKFFPSHRNFFPATEIFSPPPKFFASARRRSVFVVLARASVRILYQPLLNNDPLCATRQKQARAARACFLFEWAVAVHSKYHRIGKGPKTAKSAEHGPLPNEMVELSVLLYTETSRRVVGLLWSVSILNLPVTNGRAAGNFFFARQIIFFVAECGRWEDFFRPQIIFFASAF